MKELLKSIIVESQESKLPDLKERNLDVPLDLPMVVSLIGVRRTGKTWMLFSVMHRLLRRGIPRRNILYLNFEDERLDLRTPDLDLILQALFELHPGLLPEDCYFLFDEVQNVEGWEKFIRRIFDTLSKHIFITGSNSRLLSTEIASSLRGRTVSFTVYPLSLNEYLRFKGVEADFRHPRKKALTVHHTEQFLRQGGFPEIIDFEPDMRLRTLQGYFNTMIFRDIIERYGVSDSRVLKYFLKKLFAGIGKPLSVNKIYNELRSLGYRISNNYLYNFEEWSYNVFLGIPVSKFSFSEIKQSRSDKKIYCIDTGLLSAIEFSVSENKGKLLENMVLLELVKAGFQVFYFRGRYECDFIVKNREQLVPVQVSRELNDPDTRNRELRGLSEACSMLGVNNGLVISFDHKESVVFDGKSVSIIPLYGFCAKGIELNQVDDGR